MSSTHHHILLDFFWQVISGPPCICIQYLQNMSIFLGNMHTFMHIMYMHDKNLIKTKLILLKHVEQLLLLIKHKVDTTWVQLQPLKTQTL
jgi:hypothetical protein